jgi:hypothetical protein
MSRTQLSTRTTKRRNLSRIPGFDVMEERQMLSTTTAFVLGTNGNLWLEAPGWQQNGRTLVDSNVKSFLPANGGDVYVLGNNGNLWLEGPGWQSSGRTFIDANVSSFATDTPGNTFLPSGVGGLFVLGTNGSLWLEGPGWQQHQNGRTWVAGSIMSFAADPSTPNDVYVESTNNVLTLEPIGTGGVGDVVIDQNVQSFVPDVHSPGVVWVEGINRNLWLEYANRQTTNGRELIDGNVQSFALNPSVGGELFVLGTNGNLWIEGANWQQYGRTPVDSNVSSFAVDPYAFDTADVQGADGNLWLEAPGWQQNGRSWVDSNAQAFAQAGLADPLASTTYSPAPSAPLCNNGQPSFLDVEQGGLNDCWLLAGFADVADRNPQAIQNMFTYQGTTSDNGNTVALYTVRFYNGYGAPIYVHVNADLVSPGRYRRHTNRLRPQSVSSGLRVAGGRLRGAGHGCQSRELEHRRGSCLRRCGLQPEQLGTLRNIQSLGHRFLRLGTRWDRAGAWGQF